MDYNRSVSAGSIQLDITVADAAIRFPIESLTSCKPTSHDTVLHVPTRKL